MRKFIVFLLFLITACTSTKENVLGTSQSQVALRNFQARAFDTTNKEQVLRSVIATMQDLGFIVGQANNDLGLVSGNSYTNASRLTVTVRVRGKQIIVRANAQLGLEPIENPIPYQNFFEALSKSLFLTAHEVD